MAEITDDHCCFSGENTANKQRSYSGEQKTPRSAEIEGRGAQ